jgi:hypothetical protein
MEDRYGDHYSSLPRHKSLPESMFMDAFEKLKRIFTTDDTTRTWELPLRMPNLPEGLGHYDKEEGMVILTW